MLACSTATARPRPGRAPAGGHALLDHAGAGAAAPLRRARGSRTTSRAARSACARSTRTSRCSALRRRGRAGARRHEIGPTGRFAASDHWLDYASVTTTENFVLCAAPAHGRSRAHQRRLRAARAGVLRASSTCSARASSASAPRWLGRRRGRARRRGVHLRRRLPRGRHLPGAGRDHRRRHRGEERGPEHFHLIDRTFAKFGVEVEHEGGWSRLAAPAPLKVRRPFTSHLLQKVEAAPWPYIPADLLPIFIALGVKAEGREMFWNKVYEGGSAGSASCRSSARTPCCAIRTA